MLLEILQKLTPMAGGFTTGLMITLIMIEIPRYLLLSAAAILGRSGRRQQDIAKPPYSLVIVGHNEQGKLQGCIDALAEQSHRPDEIIVISDGSTDEMSRELLRLRQDGAIDSFHHLQLRGGKPAGSNLALQSCRNDIVVFADADTEFERHALRNIVSRLEQSGCGGVSGNVRAMDADTNILAAIQDVEYQVRISVGKAGLNMFGQVSIVSGAFGAFRKSALKKIGYYAPVSGEDLDLTLRLRRAGFKVGFARDAVCLTHVPTTVSSLIKQRYRWERDAFRLRFKTHGAAFDFGSPHFRRRELLNYLDFLFFEFLPVMITPVFLIYMHHFIGSGIWMVALLYFAAYGLCDILTFLLMGLDERDIGFRKFTLLPAYICYHIMFLRVLRFLAFSSEWFFKASERDDYIPGKVTMQTQKLRNQVR